MMFFFNDTATTEIYTLSLHDALPIYPRRRVEQLGAVGRDQPHRLDLALGDRVRGLERPRGPGLAHPLERPVEVHRDRKSTRLNSSHANISYAVFCLKKK